jgi:DNA-binding response OmpR family regulator
VSRILVVERDDPTPSGLEPDLRAAGFTAVAAGTSTAAAIVASARFDLVLLDDGLPGWRAVLDAALGCTPAVPVIVLADRPDLRSLVVALEYGAADYLGRPYRFDELAARIRRSLRITCAGDRRLAG